MTWKEREVLGSRFLVPVDAETGEEFACRAATVACRINNFAILTVEFIAELPVLAEPEGRIVAGDEGQAAP